MPKAKPQINDPGWDFLFDEAGQKHNIDPLLLKALMLGESGVDTPPEKRHTLTSPAGAIGPTQFLTSTAKRFRIDPTDPEQAINATAQYLAEGIGMTDQAKRQGVDPMTYALMYYYGGKDANASRQVAPKTWAYPSYIMKHYDMLMEPSMQVNSVEAPIELKPK